LGSAVSETPDPPVEERTESQLPPSDSPVDEEAGRMSFGEHLGELRSRLFKGLAGIVVVFLVGWTVFEAQLSEFFLHPHHTAVDRLAAREEPIEVSRTLAVLSPLEDLFFTLKASLMVALLVGFPLLLWQVWSFVAVGLHQHERKAVRRFLPWSMLLSVSGLAFCYFIFFPLVLEFLYARLNRELFEEGYRLKDYFGLYIMFTLALGMVFQLPMLMSGLSAAGLVDAKFLRRYRRHFIVCAFIFGAMFTPPEPFSQFLMAVPTITLFEIGVLLVAIRDRKRKRESAAGSAA